MRGLALTLKFCLTCSVGSLGAVTQTLASSFVYVSAATDGIINIYGMDDKTGALTPAGSVPAGKSVMPMAVSPDHKHLYAVVRTQPYRVVTYGINQQTGGLTEEAIAALPDSMPYVSVEKQGRLLFFSSYGGNKIASLPVGADGKVTDGVKQLLLTGLNAHSIVSDRTGKYVFATNLGSDRILQYILNAETGMLEANQPASIATRSGQGPRHIAVSPDNKSLYVLTELSGEILHYRLNADGTLAEAGSAKILPASSTLEPGIAPPPPPAFNAPPPAPAAPGAAAPPRIWAADLAITPDGRFLYATERTTSIIAMFRIDPQTGLPVRFGDVPTEKQPRGIRLDPTGRFLIASGEKSQTLSVYTVDSQEGTLGNVRKYPVGQGANWVEIVQAP